MRIDGTNNLPLTPHIARAYGVTPPRTIAPAQAPEAASQAGFSIAAARAAARAAEPPAPATHPLAAGRVRGSIEFDGVSVPRSNAAALNLYTRAADKIEAATAVHIGRTIDIKG